MQPSHPYLASSTLALALVSLPALALAGPDAPARTRRVEAPIVTVQRSETVVSPQEELPLQALRQREESVNYRIAYKLLNNVGLTGTEGDRKPIGYLQISGPTPLLTYHRPAAPRPRLFPHFAELPEDKKPAPPEAKPAAALAPEPAPVAVPGLPTSPNAAATAALDDAPEAGILPDPAQQAAQGRNDEILSYFQRPNPAAPNRAPGSSEGPSYGPIPAQNGNGNGEPIYLQTPEQLPIPPSRATYRVVPK